MRWKIPEPKPYPKSGDIRFKEGFLIFPKGINGDWRWLEYALWMQKARIVTGYLEPRGTYKHLRWFNIKWIEEI